MGSIGNGNLTVNGTLTLGDLLGFSIYMAGNTSHALTVNGTLTHSGNIDLETGTLTINSGGVMSPLPPAQANLE